MAALSSTAPLAALNQFKYNGKEQQTEFDLDWYDYGARMFNPTIGRWNGVDASSESYINHSPYHYAGNNPIKFIDFDGNDFGVYIDQERGLITIRANYISNSDDAQLVQDAIEFWNNQSGNYVVTTGEGANAMSYTVVFDLTSEVDKREVDSSEDYITAGYETFEQGRRSGEPNENNSVVFSKDHPSFKNGQKQGVTDGANILLSTDVKNPTTTLRHEIGHTLGMSHTTRVMKEKAGSDSYSRSSARMVNESLSRVGVTSVKRYGDETGQGAQATLRQGNLSGILQSRVRSSRKFKRAKRKEARRKK